MAERVFETEEEEEEKTQEIIDIVIEVDITEHKTDTEIYVTTQSIMEKWVECLKSHYHKSSKLLSFTEIQTMNE